VGLRAVSGEACEMRENVSGREAADKKFCCGPKIQSENRAGMDPRKDNWARFTDFETGVERFPPKMGGTEGDSATLSS